MKCCTSLPCFLQNGAYTIELVAPIDAQEAVIARQLERQGDGPYHICYRTGDLDGELAVLRKSGYVIVQPPAPAVAFEMKSVAFLFKAGVGLIELVEQIQE